MRSKFKWIFTLLVALTMQFSFAQEKTISGIVSDATGSLPGANVVVKGTTRGTQTDVDGKYTISAKAGDVLVISYVGMADKTVSVGAASTYNVKLAAGQELETVIVGAMGIAKKKNAITSSTQLVKSAEITQAANPNTLRSLAGKVSGLQINNQSNGVDGATRIVIRGPKSITNDAAALIIIDNIVANVAILNNLPAEIVESVNVIKGAQGAALYGEQGVNGVVIVTTKRGNKGGKMKITLNSSVDFESISFVPKKQSKYGQGWDGGKIDFENGGWGAPMDGTIVNVGLPQADGSYIQAPYSYVKDNIKQFYRDGTIFQNGFAAELGDENGYLLFSANNQKTDFIVQGDKLNRNTFLFKGGMKFGKLSIDGGFTYNNSATKQSDAAETLGQLLQSASSIPIGLFANSGGNEGWNVYYANPFWKRDNNRLTRTRDFYNTNIKLGYKFSDKFSMDYIGSIQSTSINQITTRNNLDNIPFVVAQQGNLSQVSEFYQTNSFSRDYYGDIIGHYKNKLTDQVNLSVDFGLNMQDNFSRVQSQGGKNLDIPFWYHILNVKNPDNPRDLRNNSFRTKSIAEFVNVDLSYRDYLFLNLTGRNESTSKLPKNNRSYFYPAVGASFVPSTAFSDTFKSTFNFMKVYANYTRVGSTAAIGTYATQRIDAVAPGFPFPSGSSYTDLTSVVDPNIKPEYYTTAEIGLNLGFFNNRLTFEGAVYKTKTTNLISNASTSTTSGVTQKLSNIGDLESKGIEIDLGFTPIKSKDFNWTGRLSYSSSRNKILSLGGQPQIELYDVGALNNITGSISAVVGESFPALMGTDWVRDAEGRVIVDALTGMPTSSVKNTYLGQATPKYILNYTNNISYKGFGLAFTLDYRSGHQFFSETKYNLTWNGHSEETADFDRDLGFIYPNSVTVAAGVSTPNTTVYTGAGYGANDGVINYFTKASELGANNVIDASALKVREISLSYNLNPEFCKNLQISSLRFSVNARNPFIVLAKGNRGFADPEASNNYDGSNRNASQRVGGGSNTSPNANGYIESGQYPSTRTIGFAINVSF